MLDLKNVFEVYADEYLKGVPEDDGMHVRPDIAIFLMLHTLNPGLSDMVSGAEHDIIYLSASPKVIARTATVQDIITMIRLGLLYDDDLASFYMFV